MNVLLSDVNFTMKPTKKQFIDIYNNFSENKPVQIKTHQLAIAIENGHSFSPCIQIQNTNKPCGNNWLYQDIICLDFDNDKKHKQMSIENFMSICNRYEIMPSIVYTTFSHNPSENKIKFRAIFELSDKIYNYKLINLLTKCLYIIFNKSFDEISFNKWHLFHGSTKNSIVYFKPINEVDPSYIYYNCINKLKEDVNHEEQNLNNFFNFTGITPQPLMGDGYVVDINTLIKNVNFSEILVNSIYKYIELTKNPLKMTIFKTEVFNKFLNYINSKELSFTYLLINDYIYIINYITNQHTPTEVEARSERPSEHSNSTGDNNKFKSNTINNDFDTDIIDFNAPRLTPDELLMLESKCHLIKALKLNTRHLSRSERWLIASNLQYINGGAKYYKQLINQVKDYFNDNLLNSVKKYKPKKCSHCEYYNICMPPSSNIINNIKSYKHDINKVSEPIYISIDQQYEDLVNAYNDAINSSEPGIYVIKAPTGSGKSHLISQINRPNTIIATDTHQLKKQIYDNQTTKFYFQQQPPEIDKKYIDQIKYFNENNISTINIYKNAMIEAKVNNDILQYEKISKYLDSLNFTDNTSIICTHEKSFHLQHKKYIDTVIYDECILKTSIKIDTVEKSDIILLMSETKNNELKQYLSSLLCINDELVHKNTFNFTDDHINDINDIIMSNKVNYFRTPIKKILSCEFFTKQNNEQTFHCIRREKFDTNKKYIIFSATANENIYKYVYQINKFYDIRPTKNIGHLYQHLDKTFSKSYAKNNADKMIKYIKNENDKYKFDSVITHCDLIRDKKIKTTDINAEQYFGNTNGTNNLANKNIAVFGTQYCSLYTLKLWSAISDIDVNNQIFDFKQNILNNKYFDFKLHTYSNNKIINDIYLFFAQSELEQAIGRARINRNNCTVHYYSHIPIVQANIV